METHWTNVEESVQNRFKIRISTFLRKQTNSVDNHTPRKG